MATKDSVSWKLRERAEYETGVFSWGQLHVLSSRHDVPLDRLEQFSREIASFLRPNFNPRVPEQARATADKGEDHATKLLKHLGSARKQLQKAQELLEQLQFKNLYGHTGTPNPTDQHRSDLADAAEAVQRFESFVEVMQREGAVVFVGKPDGRIIRDIRREAICFAAFTLWSDLERPLTYATDPRDSTRGGLLFSFVQEVVSWVTEPSEILGDAALRYDLERFKEIKADYLQSKDRQ